MNNSSRNFTRLKYLSDTLRQRFPGFVEKDEDLSLSPSAKASRRPEHPVIENRILAILARSIPRHPAYNVQALYALKVFRANDMASMDPRVDASRIQDILLGVQRRRPQFNLEWGQKTNEAVLELHGLLTDYSTTSGGDLHVLPSIETVGHRRDVIRLKSFDPGPAFEKKGKRVNLRAAWDDLKSQGIDAPDLASDHLGENPGGPGDTFPPPDVWINSPKEWTEKLELRRQQLGKINSFLDTICPQGSYFNTVRQELIHLVWSKRVDIATYKSRLKFNDRQGWHKPEGVWIPANAVSSFYGTSNACWKALQASKYDLERIGQTPRIIPARDAVAIDQLMQEHRQLAMQERTASIPSNSAKSGDEMLMGYVPEAIKCAVILADDSGKPDPATAQRAEQCADLIDQIIPYESRNTLSQRIALQKAVFENRDHFLTGTDDIERYSIRPLQFRQQYFKLLKTRYSLLEQLARELDHFDHEWPDELAAPVKRVREPAFMFDHSDVEATTVNASRPRKRKWGYRASSLDAETGMAKRHRADDGIAGSRTIKLQDKSGIVGAHSPLDNESDEGECSRDRKDRSKQAGSMAQPRHAQEDERRRNELRQSSRDRNPMLDF